MNNSEYIKNALKTETIDLAIRARLSEPGMQRLLHAGMGLATESGEFVDALKKHIFYGAALDDVNLAEEVGDLFWYCAIAADALGIDFDSIMDRNIAKLKARYGDKFSSDRANDRDLAAEREVLTDG